MEESVDDEYQGDQSNTEDEVDSGFDIDEGWGSRGANKEAPKPVRSLSRAGGLERSAPQLVALRRPEKRRHCYHWNTG